MSSNDKHSPPRRTIRASARSGIFVAMAAFLILIGGIAIVFPRLEDGLRPALGILILMAVLCVSILIGWWSAQRKPGQDR